MKKISEVIVVEGKNDTKNLKQYFDCDTIETNGTHLGKAVLQEIQMEKQRRGVIIFTDPDVPGNQIRHAINEAIPGCLNAFVNKKNARTNKKVGIEHADQKTLENALENVIDFAKSTNEFAFRDLYAFGLAGNQEAAKKRERISEKLHIGNCNGKTFLKRLNHLGITKEELEKIIHE